MANETAPSPWLTVAQAREVAQVGPKVIYRAVRAGHLRAARVGDRRDIRIHREWIDEWLHGCAVPTEVKR